MKVYISTDLEGPSGVNGRADGSIGNTIINLETARKALLNEINACIEGLVEAGADEILVGDGHGNSDSIDIFGLHEAADLLQCGDALHLPVHDSSFDASIQLGAHAMQQSGGYMCHTFNSHAVCGVWLNGEPIGEIGVGAYLDAYFGTPTILVSGDETACAEARKLLGDAIETVPTKRALSRYSAINYSPTRVYKALQEKSKRALLRAKEIPVLKPQPPFELVVRLMCPNQADYYELRGMERVDFQTVRYCGNDFYEVWNKRLCSGFAYKRVVGKIN